MFMVAVTIRMQSKHVMGWPYKPVTKGRVPYVMIANHTTDKPNRKAELNEIVQRRSGIYVDNTKNEELGLTKSIILSALFHNGVKPSAIDNILNFQCNLNTLGLKAVVSFIDYKSPYDNGPDKQLVR